jgi:Mor family transcriptional regulator
MRSFILSRTRHPNYPGIFADLNEVFGANVTAILSQNFGGCGSIYIPHTPRKNHPLRVLLGDDVAQRLCDEFGGLSVEVPRMVRLIKQQRDALIKADIAQGKTQSETAKKFQLTTRTIRTITANEKGKNKCHSEE